MRILIKLCKQKRTVNIRLMYNKHGVKQGNCLSPTLFNVYLNNLIIKFRNTKIGYNLSS